MQFSDDHPKPDNAQPDCPWKYNQHSKTVEITKNYDGRVMPYFWLRQQQMQVEVTSKKRKADSPPVDNIERSMVKDRTQPVHKR